MRIAFTLLLILACEVFSQSPSAYLTVWGIDETEKVRQDEVAPSLQSEALNSVWKNNNIEIFGARNEVVGFQLILQTGYMKLESLSIELDSLISPLHTIKNGPDANTPYDYRQKNIEIFVARYVNIDEPTSHPACWWPKAAPSAYYTGPIPDALIPIEAVYKKPPFGVSITPFNAQTIWIDVYIPNIPKTAGGGLYHGTISIRRQGKIIRTVSVALRVFDFQLPDTTHFKNFFVADNKGIKYKHGVDFYSGDYYSLEMKYHQMAHRHRMNLAFIMPLDSLVVHDRGYFTGEYFDADYSYGGPGEHVGIDVYPIGVYDQPDNGWRSGFVPATKQGWLSVAKKWLQWFTQYSPETLLLRYMIDEPDSTQYPIISERSGWLKSLAIQGKKIYSLVTTYKIDHRLFGAVDYWGLTAQSGYDQGDGIPIGYLRKKVEERKMRGEKIVLYNGTRPSSSCPHIIDTDASDSRVVAWIGWKYDIDLYFLWNTNLFYYDERRINPFNDNFTFLDGAKQWGNGTFIYPGESKDFPADDYGLKGPIASVRMKNWRRGQQDYEYLYLARSLHLETIVDSLVNIIVPAAFDDVPQGQNSQPLWKKRGFEYEQARWILAKEIEAAIQRGKRVKSH